MDQRKQTESLPDQVQPVRAHPILQVFSWSVAMVLFLWFFPSFKLILLTFLAAACLAAALRPLLSYVPGPRWIPPVLIGLIPVVLLAGIIALVSWLLAERIRRQLAELPQLRQNVNEVLAGWSQRLGFEQNLTLQQLGDELRQLLLGEGANIISSAASKVTEVLLVLSLVFFGCLYLLAARKGELFGGAASLLQKQRRPRAERALADLEPRLRWWLIGTVISMSVVGVVSYIGYTAVGLRLAAPLALLAGAAEIVPTLGPLFSVAVALLFSTAQGSQQVIGVLIVYLVIQLLESYLLLPLVMKQAVHIPPIITLFTVIFWWKIFGPGGLLLAIPIDLVIWTALEHFVIRPREEADTG